MCLTTVILSSCYCIKNSITHANSSVKLPCDSYTLKQCHVQQNRKILAYISPGFSSFKLALFWKGASITCEHEQFDVTNACQQLCSFPAPGVIWVKQVMVCCLMDFSIVLWVWMHTVKVEVRSMRYSCWTGEMICSRHFPDLWICSQELWPLGHRGGPSLRIPKFYCFTPEYMFLTEYLKTIQSK
jgi:hypothetical protein